jgi:hypothetical protein
MAASLYRIAKTECEFCAHALEGAGAGGGDSVAMGGELVARSPRKPEIAADQALRSPSPRSCARPSQRYERAPSIGDLAANCEHVVGDIGADTHTVSREELLFCALARHAHLAPRRDLGGCGACDQKGRNHQKWWRALACPVLERLFDEV